MNTTTYNYTDIIFDLTLLGEGAGAGDGSGTGDAGSNSGVTAEAAALQTKADRKNPLASVKYGKQALDDAPPAKEIKTEPKAAPTEDRSAQFEALIKGEYKDLYDAKVQDTVQKRLKSSKDAEQKYNALTPMLETLAKKYGVDATDAEALVKAIEEDDSYIEDEALERGLPVEELRSIKKMERENKLLREQIEEKATREKADEIYAQWLGDEKKTQAIYPNFSLQEEMNNKAFTDLLKAGIDVKTAFEVVHKDEILPAAMQYTAKHVEQKLANKMLNNASRPTENGISSTAVNVKSDVSQLTKADRAEIARRVARGERIVF